MTVFFPEAFSEDYAELRQLAQPEDDFILSGDPEYVEWCRARAIEIWMSFGFSRVDAEALEDTFPKRVETPITELLAYFS